MCIPQVLQYLVLIINYIFHYVICKCSHSWTLFIIPFIVHNLYVLMCEYYLLNYFLCFYGFIHISLLFLQSLFFYIIDFVFSFHQFSFPEIASRIKPDTIVWFWLDKDYKGEHTGAPFSSS